MIQRSYFETITSRINEPRKFIQHTSQDLFHPYRSVLVGEEGISIETFLKSDVKDLFDKFAA